MSNREELRAEPSIKKWVQETIFCCNGHIFQSTAKYQSSPSFDISFTRLSILRSNINTSYVFLGLSLPQVPAHKHCTSRAYQQHFTLVFGCPLHSGPIYHCHVALFYLHKHHTICFPFGETEFQWPTKVIALSICSYSSQNSFKTSSSTAN